MKYLLVSPLTNASGSAIRFWNIAHALRELGHEVIFADRKARNIQRLHSREGIRYYGFPDTGILSVDILFSFLFYCFVFLRHHDCAVFYALKPAPNNCFVALIAKITGKKIILDIDDLDYAYLRSGIWQRIARWYFDFFPRHFDLITFHTPELGLYLQNKCRVPDLKRYYLAQGISPEFLVRKIVSVSKTLHNSLIYVATLGISSDFGDLVPLWKKLSKIHSDFRLNVVGDGCRKQEFEDLMTRNGLSGNISFFGSINHSAMPEFIARHRIGVNYMRPTEVNRCRATLKIREYLACGLQVVCNDVGDAALFSEYIHIEKSIKSMFETIDSLFSDPPGFNSAGKAFIEKAYKWDLIISSFQKRVDTL